MKTRTLILCFVFLAINALAGPGIQHPGITSFSVIQPAQKVEEVIKNFLLHRQQNGVVLNWTCSSSSITNFVVQRSYDGEYFDDVDVSVSTIGRWSRATDNEVFPGYIYYRVMAIMNDGSHCYSSVQVVRIVQKK
jgi:hypothetical protein